MDDLQARMEDMEKGKKDHYHTTRIFERKIFPCDYKIQVRVIDHIGSASFVIFDLEANEFLHKSASELREQLTKDVAEL
ncbi:hypothetical protein Taro_046624, partial [Colocasia esculenta]|nr:hypothetical protein [Colocasia esculenta]